MKFKVGEEVKIKKWKDINKNKYLYLDINIAESMNLIKENQNFIFIIEEIYESDDILILCKYKEKNDHEEIYESDDILILCKYKEKNDHEEFYDFELEKYYLLPKHLFKMEI